MTTLRLPAALTVSVWGTIVALVLAGTTAAQSVARVEGPSQIDPGNLLVIASPDGATWLMMPHGGEEYYLYVASVGEGGAVDVAAHRLPIGDGPDDPPPPDATLAELVSEWADAIGDAEGQAKLAAAYQSSAGLVDQGGITTVAQLLQLQTLANTTVLGSAGSTWRPFFEKLAGYLDANTPEDLAGYHEAWLEIARGLR